MNNWQTVLTSAAVGVLVSSFVNLLGQYLERRSRRNELLLTKALELATTQRDFNWSLAQATQATVTLIDPAINAETYLRWLKSLLEEGKLPTDADKGRPKSSVK